MNDLPTILTELLDGRLSTGELQSGLKLQFKAADSDNADNRLCCFRIGDSVSDDDLRLVAEGLDALLSPDIPSMADIEMLDEEQTITGSDGRERHYRIFRWPGLPVATQLELLHVEAARRPYGD